MAVGFQYTHVCKTGVIIVLSGQLGAWVKGINPQMCTLGLSVSMGTLSGSKLQQQEILVLFISMKFSNFFCVFVFLFSVE